MTAWTFDVGSYLIGLGVSSIITIVIWWLDR